MLLREMHAAGRRFECCPAPESASSVAGSTPRSSRSCAYRERVLRATPCSGSAVRRLPARRRVARRDEGAAEASRPVSDLGLHGTHCTFLSSSRYLAARWPRNAGAALAASSSNSARVFARFSREGVLCKELEDTRGMRHALQASAKAALAIALGNILCGPSGERGISHLSGARG